MADQPAGPGEYLAPVMQNLRVGGAIDEAIDA